ncbi:MAG: rRNA maturation RNase YbeY [Candidatus Fimadaptatus sp.]
MRLEMDCEVALDDGLRALLERVMAACLEVEGLPDGCAACLRVTDDDEIHRINLEQRGVDRATDVLSFPSVTYPSGTARDNLRLLRREYDPDLGGMYLGDIVISLEHARAQAQEYGHSTERELGYLTAHALFHLMGYDHMVESDKALMRAREEAAMALVDLRREGE